MKKTIPTPLRRSVIACLWLLLPTANFLFGADPYLKDVCASGCTYSSVQAAIDSITDNDATHVYTVLVEPGVLSSDTSITSNGKDYINFIGRGMGTSVLRATAQWFSNVNSGAASGIFFDLTDSTNVTISGLTIDAKTNDSGLYANTTNYVGVACFPPVGGKVAIEGSEILGVTYALSGLGSQGSGSGGLVDVLNSRINGSVFGLWPYNVDWHVFATDIRATDTGVASGPGITLISAVASAGTGQTTLWGSHLHAQSSAPNKSYAIQTVKASSTGIVTMIGSTVHVKIATTEVSFSSRQMFGAFISGGTTLNFIGTEILYESPASLGAGRLAGIGFSSSGTYNLVGSTFRDGGGSGGTSRTDLLSLGGASFNGLKIAGTKVSSFASLTGGNPANVAKEFDTLGTQKGVATLAAGTVTVVLPVPLPDTSYRIAVSTGVNETIWVTTKTTTGFTLNSSNTSSTASVDWILMR